jgi:hypothetical protein
VGWERAAGRQQRRRCCRQRRQRRRRSLLTRVSCHGFCISSPHLDLRRLPAPAPPASCGHAPVALVGGATGRVGDPSGRSSERPVLSEAAIERNVAGEAAERGPGALAERAARGGPGVQRPRACLVAAHPLLPPPDRHPRRADFHPRAQRDRRHAACQGAVWSPRGCFQGAGHAVGVAAAGRKRSRVSRAGRADSPVAESARRRAHCMRACLDAQLLPAPCPLAPPQRS